MSQKTANHENRVRECNDILDTHLKDMQTGFMIRTNSGEFMIRDKKLIKKITKDVARHVEMVNCLNWECEGAFVAVQLIQLSRHSYLYRGFTIQKCPRNPFTFKHSYRISSNGDYYGRDFALAEAMRTVDQMYKQGGSNAR